MTVLSEEKLCDYLARVLDLSQEILAIIPEQGSRPTSDEILDRYHQLVNSLNEDRTDDSFLSDQSWNWIFEGKPSYNFIQVYGRLAWINLQLLELL